MYKSFYSLSHNPFTKEVKTNNLFPSSSFKEATARLNYLKKTKALALLSVNLVAVKLLL